MCCGDSRTEGLSGTINLGGYKNALFLSLRNYLKTAPSFRGNVWAVNSTFPLVGNGGRTTTTLLSDIQSQSPLDPNTDVALIDIGTNDVTTGANLDTACNNVDAMCSQLRADSPGITIIVAKIYDVNGDTAGVIDYNTRLATKMALRADYAAAPQAGKTFMYDQYTYMGAYQTTDWATANHLNDTGYAKAAVGWHNQIIQII